jgi:hypothetical protein
MDNREVLLIKYYKEGYTGRDIANKIGMSPPWVSTKLKKLKLKANNYASEEIKDEIKKLYSSGVQVKEIIEKLGVPRQLIFKTVKDLPKLGNQKHKIDHDFFDVFGPKQAYFIGFFLADGHLSKDNRYTFTLGIKDIDLLEEFVKWFKTDYKIYVKDKFSFNNSHKACTLQLLSMKLADKGREMGLHVNKCRELKKFPSQVETSKLFPYALKGFIDGDGWISKKIAPRNALEIISNPDVCNYLKDYLEEHYSIGCSLKKEKRCKVPLLVIRFFGENFNKIFKLIDLDIGMTRKIKR